MLNSKTSQLDTVKNQNFDVDEYLLNLMNF